MTDIYPVSTVKNRSIF